MPDSYIHEIFNSQPVFLEGFETFCYQNCQRLLLKAQGVEYPELYINAALFMDFNADDGEVLKGKDMRSLLPSYIKNVKRFFDESASAGDIFNENIRYMTENDSPVIVGIDSYYLPYASNYMKNHARHTLILCGFDLKSKEVSVIDWYPPWFYKGKVPLAEFLAGRQSGNPDDGTLFSGKSIGNNWAYIERFEQDRPKKLLKELFSTVKDNYYDCTDSGGIYHGTAAVVRIKEYLNSLQDSDKFASLYKQLNIASRRYRLFKQYLECYLQADTYEGIAECVECAGKVAENWDIVLMLILKTGRLKSEKNVQRLNLKMNELLYAEEQLKSNIFNIYESL